MWSGGVTHEAATIVIEVQGSEEVRVSLDPGLTNPIYSAMKLDGIHKITVGGLLEQTVYYYGIVDVAVGKFETVTLEPYSFSFALGNCADSGYDAAVFRELIEKHPKFLLHIGDIHYEDIDVNDVDERIRALQLVFSSESQASVVFI